MPDKDHQKAHPLPEERQHRSDTSDEEGQYRSDTSEEEAQHRQDVSDEESQYRQNVSEEHRKERASQQSTFLRHLDHSTAGILQELQSIRGGLARRPTRGEQAIKRRKAVLGLLVAIFITVQTYDASTEECGPGARIQDGVAYVAQTPLSDFDRDELQRLLSQDTSWICDVSMPIRAHGLGETWPTQENLAGLALYSLTFLSGYAWYRWPWRGSEHKPPKNAPKPWDGTERRGRDVA